MSEVENTEAISFNDLVVVGSSAGGIEALCVLVSTLPMNFPAPVVLAQHLDPSRPSSLDSILQQRTNLPVEVVHSHTHLLRGHIYVIPSNRHVIIKDHLVEVLEDRLKRPRPSVDNLLSTAAEAYGEHLIAVILTGSGSDGAIGAIEVKKAGGTIIIQDPQTARYPSMPLALPPTIVDFEAHLEQIGPLLYDLLTGVNIPPTEERTENILREILEIVSRQASIDFRPYKTSTILRRISRRMAVTHGRTMREYVEYLRTYPQEVGELVQTLLINVTQFFRDPEAFAFLKSEILPQVIEHARNREQVLRFWTAGCATGEEAYSLAMLVTDLLGTELPEWSVKIFATDLDDAAINFARRGLYSESLLTGMPADYRERFFERVEPGYRISKALRQMVIFGQQDLSRSAPFPHINLVLCRNVLIYFTSELQNYVLTQFAFSLNSNGYLLLGKAETVRPNQTYYEMVNKQWKIYRCTDNALSSGRHRILPALIPSSTEDSNVLSSSKRAFGKQQMNQEQPSSAFEFGQLRRFNELLLCFLPLGVVVIDHSYHILTANGAARRLLGLHDVAIEQDFLHAIHGIPYHDMRRAIDTVFRERNAITLPEVELDVSAGGNGRFVSLSLALMQLENGAPELAAISVTDVTEQIHIRRQVESAQVEQTQLMNELSTANKCLSDVNKELMDTNEELQVANEELVLTHEELQASIEEFETTNEELQATNEELETNNEELQATNEELETTNDELRARTNELQELTATVESERLRLADMVGLAPFSILVLRGPNLIVEAYNPRYGRFLEGQSGQGRPLDEVIDLFWETSIGMALLAQVREVYRTETTQIIPHILTFLPQTLEAEGEPAADYFTYTIVPSHGATSRVNGVILYAIDETEQHARELEEEGKRLKLIFENTTTAALALYDAQSSQLLIGSPRYLEMIAHMHNLNPTTLIGQPWYELAFVADEAAAQHLWNAVIANHSAVSIPEVVYRSTQNDQETIWDYSLIPILEPEQPDRVRFVLVSGVEITAQVRAKRETE